MGVCSSAQTPLCSNRCGRPANQALGFGLCNICYNQQKNAQLAMQQQPQIISPQGPPPYSSGAPVVIQQAPVPAPVVAPQSSIRVICPQCQMQLGLPYYAPQAQCPRCRTVFAIPQTAMASAAPQTIIVEQRPQVVYAGGRRGYDDGGAGLATGLVGGFLLAEALDGGFDGGWGDGGFW